MKIERIQTGVRMEKRLVQALNQLSTEADQNFGELMEELVLHAFEGHGTCAWFPKSLDRVKEAKVKSGINYGVHAYFEFKEADEGTSPSKNLKESSPVTRIERIQIGFKIEKRMLKVLKAIAEMNDVTPGQVLEEIALHQMEGVDAFGTKMLKKIKLLKDAYDMDYDVHASYAFSEK